MDATPLVEEYGVQGAWLLRFSTTEFGGFAFSVLTKDHRVTHYRVTRNTRYEYVMRVNGVDETFGSMSALLDGAYRLLRLRQPICTSPLDVFRTLKAGPCNGDVSFSRQSFLQLFDATGWTPPSDP